MGYPLDRISLKRLESLEHLLWNFHHRETTDFQDILVLHRIVNPVILVLVGKQDCSIFSAVTTFGSITIWDLIAGDVAFLVGRSISMLLLRVRLLQQLTNVLQALFVLLIEGKGTAIETGAQELGTGWMR